MNITNIPVQFIDQQNPVMEFVSRDVCNMQINNYMAKAVSITRQNTFLSILLLSIGVTILIIINIWLMYKLKKTENQVQQESPRPRWLGKRKHSRTKRGQNGI